MGVITPKMLSRFACQPYYADFSSYNNFFTLTCLDMWRIWYRYMISCKPDPIFLPAFSLVHVSQVFVFIAICYDKMSMNLCQIPYSFSSTSSFLHLCCMMIDFVWYTLLYFYLNQWLKDSLSWSLRHSFLGTWMAWERHN